MDNIWELARLKKDFDKAWSVVFSAPDLSCGSTRVATNARLLAKFSVLSRYLLVCTRVHALEVS